MERDEKVLLVDDEVEFTSVLAERMQARGLTVDTAASGVEALEKMEGGSRYDVVVLDLAMPGMNGMQTLERLMALNPDMQVILLTGHATLQDGIRAVRMGAREVMEKPADLSELLQKISEAKLDKIMLIEKRMEEQIQEILNAKGW
ncbi:MAG TPA: response regulator [Polyangiaceae bacterium]|nr:MAG: C4-dicarboxylate transport transcriptional regulatory protein DctD [Deltaproteobacteria bacterium ADurb.Bin207]HNS96572.1 response regulator [Polyangiaceae bacterium]HNZ24805.1 response regulator [Polyangiaceae bacterium]HOD22021.1 response regulator [Polyangiaceae bacterium]HOE47987.1 response regulator [Polyangiaceae bacterium]